VGGEALSQVWLFIVAPLVGGIVAALTYRLLFPARLETETEGLAFEGDRAAAAS
jgi:aquaporin Z